MNKTIAKPWTLREFTKDSIWGIEAKKSRDGDESAIIYNYALYLLGCENRRKNYVNLSVGDIVYTPEGRKRVAKVYPDAVQLVREGGFSLTTSRGSMSFSGGLHYPMDIKYFKATDRIELAAAWYFADDFWGKDRSITVDMPIRVWTCDINPEF